MVSAVLGSNGGIPSRRGLQGNHQQATKYAWSRFKLFIRDSPHLDIFKTSVFRFLEEAFTKHRLSPRMILSYRNYLKLTSSLAYGIDVSAKKFQLFSHTQFHARPLIKRIVPQWPLQQVLELLQGDNYNVSSSPVRKI